MEATQAQKDFRQELIKKVVEARKKKGLTQEDVANMTGIKRPNISRFESGKENFTIDMLTRIAESVGLTIQFTISE